MSFRWTHTACAHGRAVGGPSGVRACLAAVAPSHLPAKPLQPLNYYCLIGHMCLSPYKAWG
eukprot:2732682-Amphidinium_carterae.2